MVVGTVNTTCCNQIYLNLLHSQDWLVVIHALALLMPAPAQEISCETFTFKFYLPPVKLQEGNVFTGVCHSVQGKGMSGPRSFLGRDGNAWSQVSPGGIPGKYTLERYTPWY